MSDSKIQSSLSFIPQPFSEPSKGLDCMFALFIIVGVGGIVAAGVGLGALGAGKGWWAARALSHLTQKEAITMLAVGLGVGITSSVAAILGIVWNHSQKKETTPSEESNHGSVNTSTNQPQNPSVYKRSAVELFTALEFGLTDEAIRIINEGTDVNSADKNGITPLFKAIYNNMPSVVDLLVKKGANVNAQDSNKTTPLHTAASIGNVEIGKTLINNGAQINAQNAKGTTPLHVAAGSGHYDFLMLLVNNNATLDLLDNNQFNALDFANARKNNDKCINYLKTKITSKIGTMATQLSELESQKQALSKEQQDLTNLVLTLFKHEG